MINIGIISFYYKNHNYGGLLQAYALEHFINSQWGDVCHAEQICYDKDVVKLSAVDRGLRFICRGSLYDKLKHRKKSYSKILTNMDKQQQQDTFAAMEEFAEHKVEHSAKVYNERDFADSQSDYDMYISGSDQVWNPLAVRKAFLLSEIDRFKVSYAASVAAGNLKWIERIRYTKSLKAFNMISVREESAANYLSTMLGTSVEVTVDPTLLLNAEYWSSLLGKPLVNGPYIFLYYLSTPSDRAVHLINEYRGRGVKVVVIAGLNNSSISNVLEIHHCDPLGFLNLIKNVEIVFTDSFHAMAFSTQFEKKFIITRRQNAGIDMSERINSFIHLTGLEYAIADNSENDTVLDLQYDFSTAKKVIDRERKKSIEYLNWAIYSKL